MIINLEHIPSTSFAIDKPYIRIYEDVGFEDFTVKNLYLARLAARYLCAIDHYRILVHCDNYDINYTADTETFHNMFVDKFVWQNRRTWHWCRNIEVRYDYKVSRHI